MDLLGVALGRYVGRRMTQRSPVGVGGNWKAAYAGQNVDSDASALIRVILENWPHVFRDDLKGNGRSWLGETQTCRNDWAHNRTFSDSETYRALDTVELFLKLIDAPEAAEVAALKVRWDESEEQRSTPRSPTRTQEPSTPGTSRGPSETGTPDPDRDQGLLPRANASNWELILAAARALTDAGDSPFTRTDVNTWIWDRYPQSEHERDSLSPILQGMTVNAPPGAPSSACGKPLYRVSRGHYELVDRTSGDVIGNEVGDPRQPAESDEAALSVDAERLRSPNRSARSGRPLRAEVRRRLDSLIDDFDQCVETYDRSVPFKRTGQYEFHRRTIDRRTAVGSVEAAVHDVQFLELLYKTLQSWGIGIRASVLVPFTEFRSTLESHVAQLVELEPLTIESLTANVESTIGAIDFLITDLSVVDNRARIVAGTKTLHHLLPNLVPPMDRAWTGAFFGWSTLDPQNNQTMILREAFSAFVEIASVTRPSRLVGTEWRTSSTKVLDNALIGYCKLHGLGGATAGAATVQ
jgi:hypothetical protein